MLQICNGTWIKITRFGKIGNACCKFVMIQESTQHLMWQKTALNRFQHLVDLQRPVHIVGPLFIIIGKCRTSRKKLVFFNDVELTTFTSYTKKTLPLNSYKMYKRSPIIESKRGMLTKKKVIKFTNFEVTEMRSLSLVNLRTTILNNVKKFQSWCFKKCSLSYGNSWTKVATGPMCR